MISREDAALIAAEVVRLLEAKPGPVLLGSGRARVGLREAARLCGCKPETFTRRYLDKGFIRRGADKKFNRREVLRLIEKGWAA